MQCSVNLISKLLQKMNIAHSFWHTLKWKCHNWESCSCWGSLFCLEHISLKIPISSSYVFSRGKKWHLGASKLIEIYTFHVHIRKHLLTTVNFGLKASIVSLNLCFMSTKNQPIKVYLWSDRSQGCIAALWFRITQLRSRLREGTLTQV